MQKMQDAMQHKQLEFDTLKTESEAKLMALESELKKATACQKVPDEPTQQPTMSNFTRNLLQNKDNEIEKQKTAIATLEDKVWNIEQELKLASGKISQDEMERNDMGEEMKSLKLAREKAEANVAELKDKLREEIVKAQQFKAQSETLDLNASKARIGNQDDTVDRAKYEELRGAVLGLELAQDPLSEMNLSLQQSFIDDLEQATGHLDEQKRLV